MGPWALFIFASVNLRIGITELDGDIAHQLVLESDSLHARNCLDDGGFSVGDMTNGTYARKKV